MKKFKFRLQTVEKHRKLKEEEKRVALSKGLSVLRSLEANLFSIDKDEVAARRQFAALGGQTSDFISSSGFWILDKFIEGQKIRRKELKQELNKQEQRVGEIYKDFLMARQQRKSIETLREKHESVYKDNFRKYEAKQADGLYTMRDRIRRENTDILESDDDKND